MTDESGLLRALIQAAVRNAVAPARTVNARWVDQLAVEIADEVLEGLKQAKVIVVQPHALGPREE
jgi:hypothetical protein